MKLPYTICYVSKADPELSKEEIEDIFKTSIEHNNECTISGILLYSMERFFQILEGEKKEVIELYEDKIRNDPRHHDIMEIYHKPSGKPIFLRYNSKFEIVSTHQDLDRIKTYIDKNSKYGTSNKDILRILEPFILFHN